MLNNSIQFNLDTVIKYIIIHEGLVPFQTPFRITNPVMREWNTILGFKIKKDNIPEDRNNFIFLVNQDDVLKAVKQQFLNYNNNPSKYGLPNNPTIENAIRLFDQSGANGKIIFLESNIPTFDPSIHLNDIVANQKSS